MSRDQAHEQLLSVARTVAPSLAATICASGPLWFPRRRTRDLALHLCRCVVGQQLSGAAARAIWRRLESNLDCRGAGLADLCRPSAAPKLRASGLSTAKTRALIEIREAKLSGALAAAAAARDRADRDRMLSDIRGVGQWTCDMTSIFFFRDPDVWPRGDVSIQRAFRTVLDGAADPSDAQQAAFSPWRSILTLHLYRYLDGPAG
jgi:DNA-3-methyladenine glycosylase II